MKITATNQIRGSGSGGGGGGGGGATSLAGLSDVSLSGLADADRLRYSTVDNLWHNSALIWTPMTVYDPTTTNYLPLVDGSGNAIMAEV